MEEPNHPGWLEGECECGEYFCYDEWRGEYYDRNGNALKAVKS